MTDLSFDRGDTVVLLHTVTRGDQEIDLRLAGTKLWLVVKEATGDAYDNALLAKTYDADNGGDGITVDSSNPGNLAETVIDSGDTAVLTRTRVLPWALVLEEPGGERTTIDRGSLKVSVTAGDPPA